jgi:hypothetical protein
MPKGKKWIDIVLKIIGLTDNSVDWAKIESKYAIEPNESENRGVDQDI